MGLGTEGEQEVGDDGLLGCGELAIPKDGDRDVTLEHGSIVVFKWCCLDQGG